MDDSVGRELWAKVKTALKYTECSLIVLDKGMRVRVPHHPTTYHTPLKEPHGIFRIQVRRIQEEA